MLQKIYMPQASGIYAREQDSILVQQYIVICIHCNMMDILAEEFKEDVIKNTGFGGGKYVESIKRGKTTIEQNTIKTQIYTPLLFTDFILYLLLFIKT